MKVKICNLRLGDEHLQTDQDILNNFLKDVTVVKTASELTNGKLNMWSVLIFYEDKASSKSRDSVKVDNNIDDDLNEIEEKKFELLKKWRQQKSIEVGIPAYMICHNKDLIAIIKTNSSILEDLQSIRGFGEKKIASYGDEIIEIMKS